MNLDEMVVVSVIVINGWFGFVTEKSISWAPLLEAVGGLFLTIVYSWGPGSYFQVLLNFDQMVVMLVVVFIGWF